jgi:integrase
MWRKDFVEREVGGRSLVAKSTRAKYINHLENHILPRWKDTRLAELRAKGALDWLQETCESWYMMADLRNIMSGIFTKAQEWEILPETFANPMGRVKLPKKWKVRPERIPTEEETVRVLARLEDPHLLINETCIATGTRISEVTGLKVKHVDLDKGCIRIEQRHWRGDIDAPKTEKSKRTLALGNLLDRFRQWIAKLEHKDPEAWCLPAGRGQAQADVGLGRSAGAQEGRGRRRLRFPRTWTALLPAGQHHLAAGGRRLLHRGLEDRRPRQHQDHRRLHGRAVEAAGRTDPPDSAETRQGSPARKDP